MILMLALALLQAPSPQEAKKASEKLIKAPDDVASNLIVGRQYAAEAEWDKAIEHLKKVKNSMLESLFDREATAKADNFFDLVEVGDEWVKAISKLQPLKVLARDRALYWYALAWKKGGDDVWKEKLREKVHKIQGFVAASVPVRKSAGKADRWNAFNDSSFSYLDTFCYDGRFSAKLLTTGKEKEEWYAYAFTERIAPPEPGTELTISAWVYTNGTDRDGEFAIRYFDSTNKLVNQHGSPINPDRPFWTKIEFKSKVPDGANRMDIAIQHKSVPGATWLDRVRATTGDKEFAPNGSLEK